MDHKQTFVASLICDQPPFPSLASLTDSVLRWGNDGIRGTIVVAGGRHNSCLVVGITKALLRDGAIVVPSTRPLRMVTN